MQLFDKTIGKSSVLNLAILVHFILLEKNRGFYYMYIFNDKRRPSIENFEFKKN